MDRITTSQSQAGDPILVGPDGLPRAVRSSKKPNDLMKVGANGEWTVGPLSVDGAFDAAGTAAAAVAAEVTARNTAIATAVTSAESFATSADAAVTTAVETFATAADAAVTTATEAFATAAIAAAQASPTFTGLTTTAAQAVSGDATFAAAVGVVLTDTSDGHTYRIVSTAGVLSTVQVS